jgi:hypothetical protein
MEKRDEGNAMADLNEYLVDYIEYVHTGGNKPLFTLMEAVFRVKQKKSAFQKDENVHPYGSCLVHPYGSCKRKRWC